MGFDLYGANPKINTEKPKSITRFLDNEGWVKWEIMNKEQKDSWIEADDKWNDENPGHYFRNNVWWWRPLWTFVTNICADILSDEDINHGEYNDGHLIDNDKAEQIANRIQSSVDSGFAQKYEDDYKKEIKSMPDQECAICKGTGTRKGWEGWQSKNEWLKYHDTVESVDSDEESIIPGINKTISPAYRHAHRCKGCNSCHGTGKTKAFETQYPFSVENVVEFGMFCKQSGGFTIC